MTDNQVSLTDPEPPTVTDPIPFRAWAGDHADDDGRAIDDTLEAAFSGPVESEEAPSGKREIKATTRLVSRSFTLPADSIPTMLLAPDVNRVHLILTCNDVPYNLIVADDSQGTFYSASMDANTLDLSDHTGAIWVRNTDAANTNRVNVFAVSK